MGVPRSETGVKPGGTTQTAPVTPQPGGGGYDLGSVMSGYVPPGGGGGGGSDPSEPKVWFGNNLRFPGSSGGDHLAQAPDSGQVMSLTAAKNNIFTWSPAEQQAWANKLFRAGLINDPGNFKAMILQWNSAVEFAAGQWTYGRKKVTPWDVIQDQLGLSQLQRGGSGRGGAGYTGPRSETIVNSRAQILSNGDANQMIKAIFQNQVGRDPDKAELSRYRSMIINHTKENPQVSTTTTKYSAEGRDQGSTETVTGGTSEAELSGMVSDRNKADPEWGAYQAATSYMGALEQLLGGGTPDLTGSNG